MEHPATVQSTPNTAKSSRKVVEALMYAFLGLLALAFVILQVNANRKYAAELTEKLEGEAFVLNQWDSSSSGMLHTMNNIVMLLEDGIAVRVYLDSVKDMYADETSENSTKNDFQETSTNNAEGLTWSVRVSIFNRITVKVGETTFRLQLDANGDPSYLQHGMYEVYRISP